MARVYPTAAGTWSTRTWNDSATGLEYVNGTPQIDDIVSLNNLDITADQDITIAELNNQSGPNITAGGRLLVTNDSDGFSITCGTVRRVTASGVITASLTSGNSFIINSFVTSTTGTGSQGAIEMSGTGHLEINGDVQGGTGTSTWAVRMAGNGTITINGNATAGSGSTSEAVVCNNGVCTLNGAARTGASNNSSGVAGFGGLILIKSVNATANERSFAAQGIVRILDANEPNIFYLRNKDGNIFGVSKVGRTTKKASLRGGFQN